MSAETVPNQPESSPELEEHRRVWSELAIQSVTPPTVEYVEPGTAFYVQPDIIGLNGSSPVFYDEEGRQFYDC